MKTHSQKILVVFRNTVEDDLNLLLWEHKTVKADLRCGLLLQMSHVAWSVCVCVCMFVTRMCCAKTAEVIEMPFRGLTHVSPGNHVLDGVKIGRMHLQPRGVISHWCNVLQNYSELP